MAGTGEVLEIMKKTRSAKAANATSDDLLPEYRFDYKKATPEPIRDGERVVSVRGCPSYDVTGWRFHNGTSRSAVKRAEGLRSAD